MGFFKQKIKNTHIIFEAPKTGGTTLRTWIYYYLTGILIKNIDYSRDNNYYTLNGEATKFLFSLIPPILVSNFLRTITEELQIAFPSKIPPISKSFNIGFFNWRPLNFFFFN